MASTLRFAPHPEHAVVSFGIDLVGSVGLRGSEIATVSRRDQVSFHARKWWGIVAAPTADGGYMRRFHVPSVVVGAVFAAVFLLYCEHPVPLGGPGVGSKDLGSDASQADSSSIDRSSYDANAVYSDGGGVDFAVGRDVVADDGGTAVEGFTGSLSRTTTTMTDAGRTQQVQAYLFSNTGRFESIYEITAWNDREISSHQSGVSVGEWRDIGDGYYLANTAATSSQFTINGETTTTQSTTEQEPWLFRVRTIGPHYVIDAHTVFTVSQ